MIASLTFCASPALAQATTNSPPPVAGAKAAPIGTLHGLCQRILAEYPFAAGALFKGGELVSGDSLLDEITRDLLRRLNQGDASSDPLIALQRDAGVELSSGAWKAYLRRLLMPGSVVRQISDTDIRAELPAQIGRAHV